MATLALAWYVSPALTAHKPAHDHGHGHGGKAEKNKFWRELRHKGGCCCFGWSVYASWAFYMRIWALYNPKLPIWPLIGLPDLAGDQTKQQQQQTKNASARQQPQATRATQAQEPKPPSPMWLFLPGCGGWRWWIADTR
jgi:hypothetical protein